MCKEGGEWRREESGGERRVPSKCSSVGRRT